MLSDTIIVQSAISAFNNAALWAPAFLYWTILALPLFWLAYKCSDVVVERLGWTRENILENVCVWTVALIFAWVILFSGNYGVLRDELSALPMVTAVIVFLASLFLSSHLRRRALPQFGWRGVLVAVVIVGMVGLSDMHVWWGPLLQIGAMLVGGLLGWFARGVMRPVAGTSLIMMMVVIAMLMQPEFFRFGQLGNLTVVHLVAILLFGCAVVATVVLFNIRPYGLIRRGMFIKLKWLLRVVCALGGALFLLTEAVPVLLGGMAVLFVLFAMSVLHVTHLECDALGCKMFAVSLMLFGMLTVIPVISVLGILYWQNTPHVGFWPEFRRLL